MEGRAEHLIDAELLTPVDKSKVPPLHQKRIVAFVNHFLISSCSFLNEFATNCESKFIELERKMQRLEANLTVIEAKIASIPEDTFTTQSTDAKALTAPKEDTEKIESASTDEVESRSKDSAEQTLPEPPAETLVRACEDARYKKYFKMLQFGVPANAVKLKMRAEGVNPDILDTPNMELSDGATS